MNGLNFKVITNMINKNSSTDALAQNKISQKFLTFILDNEEYAINLLDVQEIRGSKTHIDLTTLIEAPAHISGILCLNDQVVPVIDLRLFYHLQPLPQNESHVIIIINLHKNLFGLAVDGVVDIVELTPEDIKATPTFFSIINKNYIDKIGKYKEHTLMILNLEKFIQNSQLNLGEHIINNTK